MPGFAASTSARRHVPARRPGAADRAATRASRSAASRSATHGRHRTPSPAARSGAAGQAAAVRDGAVAGAGARACCVGGAAGRCCRTAGGLLPERRADPAGPPSVVVTQMRVTGIVMHDRLPVPRSTAAGAPRATDDDDHVRDLIEQVLFTAPGERVNRPDVRQRAAAARLRPEQRRSWRPPPSSLVQGALQQWLGDLIEVEAVERRARDSSCCVVTVVVPARAHAASGASSGSSEAARMSDPALLPGRRAPARRSCASSTLNGIDFLEVLAVAAHAAGPLPAAPVGRARRAQRR